MHVFIERTGDKVNQSLSSTQGTIFHAAAARGLKLGFYVQFWDNGEYGRICPVLVGKKFNLRDITPRISGVSGVFQGETFVKLRFTSLSTNKLSVFTLYD